MIGWNADKIVEWLEQLSGHINPPTAPAQSKPT